MKTCICDFCKKHEATRQYKVTRKYLVFPHTTEKVDICDDCYCSLFVTQETRALTILKQMRCTEEQREGATNYDKGWDDAIWEAERRIKEEAKP